MQQLAAKISTDWGLILVSVAVTLAFGAMVTLALIEGPNLIRRWLGRRPEHR